MDDGVEEQVATSPDKRPHTRRNFVVTSAAILAVALTGAASYYVLSRDKAANDPAFRAISEIKQGTDTTLYYPSELPDGYTIGKQSVQIQNGVVFYSLTSGSKSATVSQQEKPESLNNLTRIEGLNETVGKLGKTYIGTSDGIPTAVVMADQTLVNISGTPELPQKVISEIIDSLQPVK